MTDVDSDIPSHLHNLIDTIVKKRNLMKNYQLKVRNPLKPGDNWLGVVLEIQVISDEPENEPFNFIAKLAPTGKVQRNFFPIRLSYEFEIYAYTKILPELIKLQTENNVRNIFDPFAKCYQTLLSDGQETLVLENMCKHGYKPFDNRHPVELRHASLIMTALGKLHALSFVLKNQRPELFKEISLKIENSFFHSNYGKVFIKITQNIGKQVLNRLTKNEIAHKSFENFLKDPSFVIDKLLKSEAAGKYAVICHGDAQTRNMLFKYKVSTYFEFLEFVVKKF
ncbi:hypothetical protein FQR65_LT08691 [Abscondita terminalis]|nr:hypothetical protein FQR65_LT08691 [Abscondita terminalis]